MASLEGLFPTLLPTRASRLVAFLLVASAILHLAGLSSPREVVFDEVHFGAFASHYVGDGKHFFDIHPPHAKLLISLTSWLGGYRGGAEFDKIGDPLDPYLIFGLRFAPALVGTLIPALVFHLARQLGAREAAAFLAGFAILFENGLLVQTRMISLDGILVASALGSISCLLAGLAREGLRARGLALAAGALAGFAVGTKLTGLATFALLALLLLARMVDEPRRIPAVLLDGVLILVAAAAVYLAGWWIHFAALPFPGTGDAFYKPTGHFLRDTYEMHVRILDANKGLTTPHSYSSPWWSWPLMARPIFYWTRDERSIYLLGNPIVWWGSSALLVAILTNMVLARGTDLEIRGRLDMAPPRIWVPITGFALWTFPHMLVSRVMFLYHYFLPLAFAVIAGTLWLEHAGLSGEGRLRDQRTAYKIVGALVLNGFAIASPVTFGWGGQEWLFRIAPGWR